MMRHKARERKGIMEKGLNSLIETTARGLREKKDFASRWCEYFTEDCIEQLKAYAEFDKGCGHDCEYCQKFKWIIDRAKHYEDKLGIPWREILESWEEDRSYWYMNYYQDCEQPLIKSGKVRVFDTMEDFNESVKHSEYICPSCGKVSSDPYECKGCGWKVYGLFGDLGKGIFVYIKEKKKGQTIFKPKAWSDKPQEENKNADK